MDVEGRVVMVLTGEGKAFFIQFTPQQWAIDFEIFCPVQVRREW